MATQSNEFDRVKAALVLFLATLTVSFAAILVRFSESPPIVIAFYRLFFATLFMLFMHIMVERNLIKKERSLAERTRMNSRDYLIMAMAGLFLALHFWSWFTSLFYTSVAVSVALTDTSPMFVAILSWLILKEKINKIQVSGMVLAILGVVFVTRQDLIEKGLESFIGDMLALFSAVAVAIYFLVGRKVRKKIPIFLYTTIVYGSAALFLFILVLLKGDPLLGLQPREYVIFMILGFFVSGVGHTLYNFILKHVKAPIVTTTVLGEVIISTILAWILFNEALTSDMFIGGMMIILGILLTVLFEKPSSGSVSNKEKIPE